MSTPIIIAQLIALALLVYFRRPLRLLWGDVRSTWFLFRTARQTRRILAKNQAARASLKGEIKGVGEITTHPGGIIELGDGWDFDLTNGALVHQMGQDGVYRFCGYTKAELLEIHKRRDEFAIH